MTDHSTKDLLARLPVPPHNDDFWENIQAALHEASGTPVVRARPALTRPTAPVWIAAAAALALVLAVGLAVLVIGGDGPDRRDAAVNPADGASAAATSADPVATPLPATVTGDTGEPGDRGEPATSVSTGATVAPWNFAPLAQDSVPAVLVDEWNAAENLRWCPALYPEAASADVAPRAADFSGGWALAWDLPAGPGSDATGAPCEDCGRSAYGVAGLDLSVQDDTGVRMPQRITFDDGAVAGYSGEGFDASATKRVAEMAIPGHGCVYQVWSHLGDEHLLSLLTSLRSVEGLDAGDTTPRTAADTEVIDGGAPPWASDPVPVADIPDPLAVSGAAVTVADAASLVPGARPRTVNGYSWGAAWDARTGPGHDSLNFPCEHCGRGVIGLVAFANELIDPTARPDPVEPWLAKIEWDDGSVAYVRWRFVDLALPLDVATVPASDTGNLVSDGYEARLFIDGIEAELQVWSHLGFDHLVSVLDHLRLVGS